MSLQTAEMGTNPCKAEAQQSEGVPAGTGTSDPCGSPGTELDQPVLAPGPHEEGNAGPQQGQNQSPTKSSLGGDGRAGTSLTQKQDWCLFQEISWGKLSPSVPSLPKEQWLLPISAAVSLFPAGTKGHTHLSCVLTAATAALELPAPPLG